MKFAELSQNRLTDYVFAWDRMLALHGDTAPYLQYSTVRIRSIFRKLDAPFDASAATITLNEEAEIHLARLHARFGELLPADRSRISARTCSPTICWNWPAPSTRSSKPARSSSPTNRVRSSRLALCELTSRILTTGLGLLGIRCPERM